MILISSPETAKLARELAGYEPRATIACTAGLLTAPELQANTIRLELLVHLAVVHCAGKKKPSYGELGRWLNDHLGHAELAMLEDPVEDVFVTNVNTPEGNRRIFEGIWESNDYYLQVVLNTLLSRKTPRECRNLLHSIFALLRLSDCVAERMGLYRWHIESSIPKGVVNVAQATLVEKRARAVTFTSEDIEGLGITRTMLAPFVLREEDRIKIIDEWTGHSSLERRPLVDFGDSLVLALPPAISPAIRRFALSELRQMGYLQAFEDALGERQARQVEKDGLRELRNDTSSLSPPQPDNESMPSLHAWLLKYDVNKYLHVVLLHDRLDRLDAEGLSSFMEYPEDHRLGLEKYLNKVAKYCQAQPDCAEGMSLLVLGGLGRGFALGFNEWPDAWRFSVIRVSDLLMLAKDVEQPIKRYLKCIKQKEWAENEGVYFQNINGYFNFYCYWRRLNCQLVPREMPVGSGSMISIGNDFVLPVRQELRKLVDSHVVQTASGPFAQVERYDRNVETFGTLILRVLSP